VTGACALAAAALAHSGPIGWRRRGGTSLTSAAAAV